MAASRQQGAAARDHRVHRTPWRHSRDGCSIAMRGHGATSPSSAGPRRWCRPIDARWSGAFGPRVFETYGSRETMLIAAECAAHDGMHVVGGERPRRDRRGRRPSGRSRRDGSGCGDRPSQHGHAPHPLREWRHGNVGPERDVPLWSHLAPHRACRRASASDTMRDARGAPVPGMLFISLLNAHEAEIKEFQAVQKAVGRGRAPDRPGAGMVERSLRRDGSPAGVVLRQGLPFEIALVDAIPPDPSGKRRAVDRRAVRHGAPGAKGRRRARIRVLRRSGVVQRREWMNHVA